jgi:hypothetical protein
MNNVVDNIYISCNQVSSYSLYWNGNLVGSEAPARTSATSYVAAIKPNDIVAFQGK